MKPKAKIDNFVILPREIRDLYAKGRLSKNEFDVLIWVWLNANPVNGFFMVSYRGIIQDLKANRISYDNIRRIFSSLLASQLVYFAPHKGRQGSFAVYPVGFLLTSGEIQTLEYLKRKDLITTKPPNSSQLPTTSHHNSKTPHHNLEKEKSELTKRFSMN